MISAIQAKLKRIYKQLCLPYFNAKQAKLKSQLCLHGCRLHLVIAMVTLSSSVMRVR